VTVLFTNGEQMEVQRSAVSVQKGRSPIDAWPDAFIFFDRYGLLLLIELLMTSHTGSVLNPMITTPYISIIIIDLS
jgi:hypothetical protein